MSGRGGLQRAARGRRSAGPRCAAPRSTPAAATFKPRACPSISPSPNATAPQPNYTAEQLFDPLYNPAGPHALPKYGTCSSQLRTVNITQLTRAGFRLSQISGWENPKTGCIEVSR